ncbi:hypothetical protein MHYP_G00178540 [Metynnis hypsauchen]
MAVVLWEGSETDRSLIWAGGIRMGWLGCRHVASKWEDRPGMSDRVSTDKTQTALNSLCTSPCTKLERQELQEDYCLFAFLRNAAVGCTPGSELVGLEGSAVTLGSG